MNKVNTMFWLNDNSVNELNKRYGHRCYTFKTEGRIVYNPTRGKKTDPHWCIIELDKEITRYYRYLFKKRFGYDLYSPSFDAHVSLLKGFETPKMSTEWKNLDGKVVEVLYDSNLYWNHQHVWLNSYCEEYFTLREFYEIPDWNTKDFSHITVGKFKA